MSDDYALSLTDDELDDLVVTYFPSPIALAYTEMLSTENLAVKAHAGLKAFHFGTRTISLALVIRYLEDKDIPSDPELNSRIKKYLPNSFDQYWIELLELVLKTYQDHKDSLFIRELHDLYWQETPQGYQEKIGPWAVLKRLAGYSNDIEQNIGNPASLADSIVRDLRQLMRHFLFMVNYELWYVESINDPWLEVIIYNGTHTTPHHVNSQQIEFPNFKEIRKEFYYLTSRQDTAHYRLLELDPLVVDAERIVQDRSPRANQENDAGLYNGYFEDPDKATGEIQKLKFMLLAQQKDEFTNDKFLLERFRVLTDYWLDVQKMGRARRGLVGWEGLKTGFEVYATEQQIHNAQEKYAKDDYVPRHDLETVLGEFLASESPAIAVTGDAGMGKTNLLLNLYYKTLLPNPDCATLWLDGAGIKTQESFVQWLVSVFDDIFKPSKKLPFDSELSARHWLNEFLDTEAYGKQLVIIVDGINENSEPIKAFSKLNTFVNELRHVAIKVIISSRPQVWRHSKRQTDTPFRPERFYHPKPGSLDSAGAVYENDSFVLRRYTHDEQIEAFQKYSRLYKVQDTQLGQLNARLQDAMRDPLILTLICKAHQAKAIPTDFSRDQIIPELYKKLAEDSKTLQIDDVEEFLQRQLVPQFLPPTGKPVSKLTRAMIDGNNIMVEDLDGTKRRLHLLIANNTLYSDGTPVNARFQRLMGTGWVVMLGESSSYEVRFHYEYFYDYFVGEHLKTLAKGESNRAAFFVKWVDTLETSPFLWGAMRHLLVSFVKKPDGDLPWEIDLVAQLGKTDKPLQRDLILSVVEEYYDESAEYADKFHPMLVDWLRSGSALAEQNAVILAARLQIQDVLVAALAHRKSEVRGLAIQQMHGVWQTSLNQEPDIAKNMAILTLQDIAQQVRWRKITHIGRLLESLLKCTLLIIMRDYVATVNHHETVLRQDPSAQLPPSLNPEMLTHFQQIWRVVMGRLFGIKPKADASQAHLGFLKRRLLRLITRIAVPIVALLEDQGQVVMSIKDTRAFFKANEQQKAEHRANFQRMIPHLDAAGNPNVESLTDLQAFLENLVATNRDFLTSGLGLAILVAHIYKDPLETNQVIHALFDKIVASYPETTDVNEPTASPWLHMILFPYSNLPYNHLEQHLAETILADYSDLIYDTEKLYRTAVLFESGKKLRTSLLADPVVWGYKLKIETGPQHLMKMFDLVEGRDDYDQIRRFVGHLCECISYHQIPEAAFSSIADYIEKVKPYLKKHPEHAEDFWKVFETKVIQYGSFYPALMADFAMQIKDDEQIPARVINTLLSAPPKEDFGGLLIESGLWFVRTSLKDRDPAVRGLVKWVFEESLEVKSLSMWVYRLIIYLSELVYGAHLFGQHGTSRATDSKL